MLKSFTVSFFVLIIPLLLNLLMVHIVFAGGTYIPADVEMLKSESNLLQSYSNPMFYNILYILVFSFIGGIVGSGATALAMAFPNRFISLSVSFHIMVYIDCHQTVYHRSINPVYCGSFITLYFYNYFCSSNKYSCCSVFVL